MSTKSPCGCTSRTASWSLVVEDRGNGFDVNARDPKGTGLGLYGMKERAELVNGEIVITSEPGKGTTVLLKVPVGPDGTVSP